ncbi:MAG: WYL domain-containing protein [Candidatus Dormibacteraeota bacterium]|nr:WYL domain-containing protein [Candidatus Dormibacteraeota bacterium]
MPEAAVRLLRLLDLLHAGPGLRGRELAGELGVTDRTLRRDVERLRSAGYPIRASPGPGGGGYRLGDRATLPPLVLSRAEAAAVAVTLGAPGSKGVAQAEAAAVSSLAKLDRLLPADVRRQVTSLRAAAISLDRSLPRVPTERLVALAACCQVRERVNLEYEAGDGHRGLRRVEPYRLVATEEQWYLVAYDLDRSGWRTFRVDRMGELERTGWTFTPRPGPDPGQLVAQAVAVAPYRYRVVAELDAPVSEVSAHVPSSVSMVEAAGERTKITFGVHRLDWAAGFLVDLGVPFVVTEPEALRRHLRNLGLRLTSSHGGGTQARQGRAPNGAAAGRQPPG